MNWVTFKISLSNTFKYLQALQLCTFPSVLEIKTRKCYSIKYNIYSVRILFFGFKLSLVQFIQCCDINITFNFNYVKNIGFVLGLPNEVPGLVPNACFPIRSLISSTDSSSSSRRLFATVLSVLFIVLVRGGMY